MFRRLILVGMAAALAAPIVAISPASSAVLFSCTSATGSATIAPGLGATPTAQTDLSGLASISGCTNGQTGSAGFGTGAGLNVVDSVGGANGLLNCTTTKPNNTKILSGNTFPNMNIDWASGADSSGLTTVKTTGTVGTSKAVLKITSGQYAPAKVKATFTFTPSSGSCTYEDPVTSVTITLTCSVIVQN